MVETGRVRERQRKIIEKIGRTREIINSYYKRIFLILRSHVKKNSEKRKTKKCNVRTGVYIYAVTHELSD